MRGVVVAAVVAACVLAAGCGGGEAVPAVRGEPIALGQLSRSANRSAEATSGRFAFAMKAAFPGAEQALSFSGEGAFDKRGERASFAVDLSSFAQLLGGFAAALAGPGADGVPNFDDPDAWRVAVVQDGNVSYVRFPAVDEQLPEGKTWIRSDGRKVKVGGLEVGELQQLAGSDPRDLLGLLRSVGGEIETVGVEELRGVATTHYRATLDPAEYAKNATPEERANLGPLAEPLQADVGEVPVDVWLDGGGMVRKVSFDLSAEDQGRVGSAAVTFELWDYGEDVEIGLPPADEVVDASALRS